MHYRKEIDGLRALAVLPVVFFHANISGFQGGFIGVDIFFVISGYLITNILWADFDSKNFSILRFYERRTRRILPALFTVLGLCIPFGLAWLSPSEMAALSASALATIAFISNFYFLDQSGYFAPAADSQPLLHTWSLAIEEQFYVIFPLVLLFLHRRLDARWAALGVAILGLTSFGLAELFRTDHADATFFLAPFRAWELMAGSVCALAERMRPAKGNAVLGIAGIAMIALGFVSIDPSHPFPSAITLLPVVGTALVICYARTGTLAASALSLRPLVFVGLISYSLYLWHQPLLAFARIRKIGPLSDVELFGILALSLVLSIITWRLVEQPFRKGYGTQWGKPQLAGLASAACAIILIFSVGIGSGGYRQRFSQSALAAVERDSMRAPEVVTCKIDYTGIEPKACNIVGNGQVASRIAVIGDSHASQLFPALEKMANAKNWSFDLYAKSSCPIVEIPIGYAGWGREYFECQQWREKLWQILSDRQYDLVLIAHSTLSYAHFNGRYNLSAAQWKEGFAAAADRFTQEGVDWAILLDNPQFRLVDPVRCATRAQLFDSASARNCEIPREVAFDLSARQAESDVATSYGRTPIDLAGLFCDSRSCSPMHGRSLMMSDANHLSETGALILSQPLEVALVKALQHHDQDVPLPH